MKIEICDFEIQDLGLHPDQPAARSLGTTSQIPNPKSEIQNILRLPLPPALAHHIKPGVRLRQLRLAKRAGSCPAAKTRVFRQGSARYYKRGLNFGVLLIQAYRRHD